MSNIPKGKTAIFSIKPKYASLIFSGLKTVELRRRAPRLLEQGSQILFWESSPAKHLSGSARVVKLAHMRTNKLWGNISGLAGISRTEFNEYFEGAEMGVALFLEDPIEFDRKPNLPVLREKIGFQPPQSFRYASITELRYFQRSQTI